MGVEDSHSSPENYGATTPPYPHPMAFEVRSHKQTPDYTKGYLCLTNTLEPLSSQLNDQPLLARHTSWHWTQIMSSRDAHTDKGPLELPLSASTWGTPLATKEKLNSKGKWILRAVGTPWQQLLVDGGWSCFFKWSSRFPQVKKVRWSPRNVVVIHLAGNPQRHSFPFWSSKVKNRAVPLQASTLS